MFNKLYHGRREHLLFPPNQYAAVANFRRQRPQAESIPGNSKIMDQPEKILLGDQDIINLLFKGHIVEVPVYYNFQRLIHKAYCLKNPSLIKKVVIAHFITGDKPWNNDYLIVFAREYYSYLRKYLTPKQRAAWWLGKPKGVVNMFQRHRKWTDLQKQGTN